VEKSKADAIAGVGPTLLVVPHSVMKHLILPHVKDETVLVLSQTCKRLNHICSSYLLMRSEELFPEVPPQVMNIVAKVRCEKMFEDVGDWIGWSFVQTFFRLTRDSWDDLHSSQKTVSGVLKATLIQFKGASAWYETDIALRKTADAWCSIEDRELRLNQLKGWRLLPNASVRFLEAYRLHGKESWAEIYQILNESVLRAELARRIADRTGKSAEIILEYFYDSYTENIILQAKHELFCFEKVVEAFETGEEEKIFVKLRELDLMERISKFLEEELKVQQWISLHLDDLEALLRNLLDQSVIQAYLSQETSLENALEEILPQVRERWQEWWDATDLVEFRDFQWDSFVARAYDDEKFAKHKLYMFVVSHSVCAFFFFLTFLKGEDYAESKSFAARDDEACGTHFSIIWAGLESDFRGPGGLVYEICHAGNGYRSGEDLCKAADCLVQKLAISVGLLQKVFSETSPHRV
jgi:hypothetical protein